MTSRDFCYWLQGFFEVANPTTLSEEQVKIVSAHLNLVFKHEIDPENLKGKSPRDILEYSEIHRGRKDGDNIDADMLKIFGVHSDIPSEIKLNC